MRIERRPSGSSFVPNLGAQNVSPSMRQGLPPPPTNLPGRCGSRARCRLAGAPKGKQAPPRSSTDSRSLFVAYLHTRAWLAARGIAQARQHCDVALGVRHPGWQARRNGRPSLSSCNFVGGSNASWLSSRESTCGVSSGIVRRDVRKLVTSGASRLQVKSGLCTGSGGGAVSCTSSFVCCYGEPGLASPMLPPRSGFPSQVPRTSSRFWFQRNLPGRFQCLVSRNLVQGST